MNSHFLTSFQFPNLLQAAKDWYFKCLEKAEAEARKENEQQMAALTEQQQQVL